MRPGFPQTRQHRRHYKKLDVGDHVRVAQLINPTLTPKPSTFWEERIVKVVGIVSPKAAWNSATYVLSDDRRLTRDKLQKVDVARLVRLPRKAAAPEQTAPRPQRARKPNKKYI